MMNLFRRGMIFVTFFGSCLAIALLVAALGTKFWIVSGAKRVPNPNESDGRIHFGLFTGKKELNVAYGWRVYEINVLEEVRADPEFLHFGLWAGTVACVSGGLLLAAVSAVFAVINTATTPIGTVTGVPGLYVWNSLGLILDLSGVILWAVQYHTKLKYNVINQEDMRNEWRSENLANFGYSFWFVVGAIFVHVLNMGAILFGTYEKKERKAPKPITEEKTNGAIMLY